jgi:Ig-like domain CHU_C associated/Secretion system C-terminal sorting domain/Periplasmic copper-binding protein (NosD)
MRKILVLVCTLVAFNAMAAYNPITVTGYNADVVANGVGAASASTTHDVDSVNYAFLAPDYQLTSSSALPTVFLPGTGLINSVNTSGLSFQLAGYGGLNNLRLQTTSSGVLNFATPSSATIVYLLACSGSGSSIATVTIKFADNSTQVFSNVNFNDWYGGSGFAIGNIGRVLRTTGATELTGTTGPRLYEVPLALNAANFSKNIISVTITRTGGSALNSILNVMAVSTSNTIFPGGGYTINSTLPTSGTNYTSFTDAVTALSSGAITGAVTFTVAPGSGPYNEKITIPAIAGASSTNRVTFNCNGRTMAYNTSDANNRCAIILNGADFVTIDSLVVDVSAGTYGWGILLTNGADSNIIRKCTINASQTNITSGNHFGIIMNGSATATATTGVNGNGNLFTANTINGGFYGVYLYGSTTAGAYNKGNIISNSIIKEFYSYGVYLNGQDSSIVSNNDISRPTRTTTTTTYGINSGTNTNILIEKNKVHNLFDAITGNASTTYAIYSSGAGVSAALPNRIENNLVYKIASASGTAAGIYSFSNFTNAYHNTVFIDEASTAGTTYGIYFYGTSSNLRNNIAVVARGGTGTKYCVYIGSTAIGVVNNNVWQMASTTGTSNNIGYYSVAIPTFAAWQAANGGAFDQQGRNIDPLFISPSTGDFKPSEATINDMGATGTGVLTDLFNVVRTANPDPGAIEFALPPCTGTPTAGAVSASATNVCNGATFILNLTGNSIGSGLTFQWQSSPTLTGTYTNVGTAQTSPFLSTTQTASAFYRCAVRCGTGTIVNSGAVQVVSPSLVSGTAYTINSAAATGGSNFNSFTDAINFVKCGISGPVTFTVASGSGPYNEAITIPQIFGASATNKVTIRGNGVTLNYNTSDANARTAITFNGADNIILDSLNIDVSQGTYGWGIALTNGADSNIIRKCTIITSSVATATTTNHLGIIINGSTISTTLTSGNNGNGNLIDRNTITGGYYGIYLCGNSASGLYNANNIISNNTIADFYYYGLYVYYQTGLVISANDISRATRTAVTTTYGINVITSEAFAIEKNKVHNLFDAVPTNTSTVYGIYVSGAGISAVQPNKIENNILYKITNSGGSVYGIYNFSNFYNIDHNTILIDEPTSAAGLAYAIYNYGTNANARNNIATVNRGGAGSKYCMYIGSTTVGVVNNNVWVNTSTTGTNGIGYYSTGFTTFAAWQAANSAAFDQQGLNVDPVFANPSGGDLTPTSSLVNNTGSPVGVLTDIKNATRSTTSPDAGAYEFSTLTVGLNYGAEGLVTPAASTTGCYTNNEVVKVRIRNNRTTTHNYATNPVTVTVNITGALTQTQTFVLNTGTLASDATQEVTFATPINMSAAGTYNFAAYTTLTGDVNTGNDAMLPVDRTKNSLDAGTISASPATYCGNAGTLPTLNATAHTGYSSFVWQVSNTTGTGFTDISGANTSPYSVTGSITQNKYYRLKATCGSNNVNSAESLVTYTNPTILTTTPATRCGTGTLNLAATGSTGATISWYAALSGGTSLFTGNTFTTPSISATTTYYAAAGSGSSTSSLGLQDRVGATANTGYTDVGLMFDAVAPFTLQSVAIYPLGTGAASVTIDVKNAAGTTIQTYTGNVTASATPGVKTVIPVNFAVPAGTGMRLVMNGATGLTGLIREVTTGYTYPYTISGIASITSAYTGGASSAYYYYFYDWQVVTGCQSARTSVTATIDNSPTCTPTPVTLLSFKGDRVGAINKLEWTTATEQNNAGFSLQRSVDGVNFSQLQYVNSKATGGNSNSQLSYTYDDVKPLQGNNYYRLQQKDRDGKTSYSQIVLLKGARVSTLMMSNVYPNPTVQALNMILSSPVAEQVRIVVSDATGKIVWQQSKQVAQGDNNVQINVQALATGSYVVKAICNTGCETAVHKFVKQ